jgi:ADP-ribose pyrophosphatase YjhB (NUDIX family)
MPLQPPTYEYCPYTADKLIKKMDEEGRERSVCPSCGWVYYPAPHTAVAGVVLDGTGKVLLVQRGREPKQGLWSIPAGFVEFGELPEETLRREIDEETDLKVIDSKLMTIMQSLDDPRAPGTLVIFYQVTVQPGELSNADLHENSSVAWWPLTKLPPMAWENHRSVLEGITTAASFST